ncbi:lysine transporter LysE [Pedobacter yulinensis]|uniref:Lysine transporter LysE n=1 Tax=Pedobacter yulinensis TaxID=2126353 RepID=A0A2T3HLT9_9SPHI|nr:LysE family translocator [Pedobacter yulinensis]PST83412.1 lysine transporter LysE [Pedobacter yulinensis]
MIPFHDILVFAFAAFILVISPGPNMIYLISRSITQGKKAGLISLLGVACGFLFHILMVAYGLTALLFAVPLAYTALKVCGVGYLLYLAFQAVRPNGTNVFAATRDLPADKPGKLFRIGLFTNVLNPKTAVFYMSLFPQFIHPEHGSVAAQCLQLGFVQIAVSFSINFLIIMSAARAARFFARQPAWISVQQWVMASVLTWLALKIAFSKAK